LLVSHNAFGYTTLYKDVVNFIKKGARVLAMRNVLLALFVLLVACTPAVVQECEEDKGQVCTFDIAETLGNASEKHIRVELYDYGFKQTGDTIQDNDTVHMTIVSTQGVHGLSIPTLGITVPEVREGQEKNITFTARAGQHNMTCMQFCGQGHYAMHDTMVIE
jgi:nitrous oxide reductase